MTLTLEQIAALAGVSRSTVSRVVNGHSNVDAETRARVLRVIQEYDFQPNKAARTLASRRSQIIGMVIPQALSTVFADPYFPILIQGILGACDAHGYTLVLSLMNAGASEGYRRIIGSGHLDGLIVASALTNDALVDRLLAEGVPFVLIGRHLQDANITTVDADNVRGAGMAVQHLVRLGHTRIATITGPQNMVAAVDRQEGFLAGMRAAGLAVPDGYVQEGDWSEWSGQHAMSCLLQVSPPPQAVFVASDSMAIGALKVLRAAGRRVPDDMALVGFDDIPLASAIEPPLTTIRQPIERLGFIAATTLLDMLRPGASPADSAPHRIVLPTELVLRESCGQAQRYAARQVREGGVHTK